MPSNNPIQSIATHEHFIKNKVQDGVLEANVLLSEIKRTGQFDTGVTGTKLGPGAHRKSQFSVTGWGPGHTANITQPDMHVNYEIDWAGLYADYYIDEWDTLANNGPEAIFNMQKRYAADIKDDMAQTLEDYCFLDGSTSTPTLPTGVEGFVAATGTYATRSQTNTDWKAHIVSGASGQILGGGFDDQPRPFLRRLITVTTRGASKGGRNTPNMMVCDRNHWNHIHDDIESNRRVVSSITRMRAGFHNIVYDGVPIYWSDSATASKVYALNTRRIKLCTQTKRLLQSRSVMLPQPIGMYHQCYSKLNLLCEGPRYQGKISATGIS